MPKRPLSATISCNQQHKNSMQTIQKVPTENSQLANEGSTNLLLVHQYQSQLLPHNPHFVIFHPPKVSLKDSHVLERRNHHLKERLLGDVAIGCAVTAVVSPFLTVIDKALVQASTGSHSLLGSATTSVSSMVRNPVAYLKSPTFLWMWATYAATYSAANSIKTMTEHQAYMAATTQTTTHKNESSTEAAQAGAISASAIFFGTTFANTSACLLKDRAYAKLFGNAAATKVPAISYGAWIMRDFAVIGSSFILPDYVAPVVKDTFGMSETMAKSLAQVGTPMAAQLVASPLHFFGLDCYNRNLSHLPSLQSRVLDRSQYLAKMFREVTFARMLRILPGYGIAGVWNARLRNKWQGYWMHQEVKQILQHEDSTSSLHTVSIL